MSIGVATDPSDTMVHLGKKATGITGNGDSDPCHDEETITTVYYKPQEDRSIQMKGHAKVNTEDALTQEE